MDIKLCELIDFFSIFFRNDFVCRLILDNYKDSVLTSVGSAPEELIYKTYKNHYIVSFAFNCQKEIFILIKC